MEKLNTYIGINPFTVLVDESLELSYLTEKARQLSSLDFKQKLNKVKKLSLEAMTNAYEMMLNGINLKEKEKGKDIVMNSYPLSYALKQKAGCCRYQGALFFVLGYEADLGDKHFIQGAPVNQRTNTVFNEIIQDKKLYQISIFTESLKDKSLDYSKQNPKVFKQAFKKIQGLGMYSYHRTKKGLVLILNPESHIKQLK